MLIFGIIHLVPGTILENNFGRLFSTRESEVQLQLRCTRRCDPPVRVEMHNPGSSETIPAGNHNFFSVFKV